MRIAFFGGSFDPPHIGHLKVAQAVLQKKMTDKVMFAPAFSPPHKPDRTLASFDARMEMLKILLSGCRNMLISDVERKINVKPSYTAKILENLNKTNTENQFQLLIGGDSLANFHLWYKAKEIIKNWQIIVYPRFGDELNKNELLKNWSQEESEILLKNQLQMPYLEISSTSLRKKLQTAESVCGWLPDKIVEYIRMNKLYC